MLSGGAARWVLRFGKRERARAKAKITRLTPGDTAAQQSASKLTGLATKALLGGFGVDNVVEACRRWAPEVPEKMWEERQDGTTSEPI